MCLILFGHIAAAQNNPIFFGGIGDGYNRQRYGQLHADTVFCHGGNGDGFSRSGYLPQVALHTTGGSGDGYAGKSYTPVITQVTTGGTGDGYGSIATGLPASDRIFYGGNSDGWSAGKMAAPAADPIFFGGAGDGWSSDYLLLSPLPLTLLSFDGREQGAANILHWRTASEINTAYFVLERSATARQFTPVGTVNATGNTHGESDYSFTDAAPLDDNNFYRLKMTDADGKFTYSNIVLLKRLRNQAVLTVYPNPAAAILYIKWSGAVQDNELVVDVYDASARLVKRKVMRKDNNTLQLDVQPLAAGTYTIRIADGKQISVVRFVKN